MYHITNNLISTDLLSHLSNIGYVPNIKEGKINIPADKVQSLAFIAKSENFKYALTEIEIEKFFWSDDCGGDRRLYIHTKDGMNYGFTPEQVFEAITYNPHYTKQHKIDVVGVTGQSFVIDNYEKPSFMERFDVFFGKFTKEDCRLVVCYWSIVNGWDMDLDKVVEIATEKVNGVLKPSKN